MAAARAKMIARRFGGKDVIASELTLGATAYGGRGRGGLALSKANGT